MADIIDFRGRMKARQAEGQNDLQRVELTAKMIPVMVATVETFTDMGAPHEHIVRFLQATIDELQGLEAMARRQRITATRNRGFRYFWFRALRVLR